jgi:hypothetical protein
MEPDAVLDFIAGLWTTLTSPQSTWLQTLLSGAIGAAVGSFATQSVISRYQQVSQARSELRATNHAINICFTIVNHYLGFKRQMVRPTVIAFEEANARVQAALQAGPGQVELAADLTALPKSVLPIDHLETLVLEKVGMGGRGLSAAMQLRSAHDALNGALAERERMIHAFQAANFNGRQLAETYLGLETARGADTRFKDNIRALSLYTNDCIFFAHIAARDLRQHGIDLVHKEGRKLGSVRRSVSSFDFDDTPDNLVPPDSDYDAWLKGFPVRRPWWKFWNRDNNALPPKAP